MKHFEPSRLGSSGSSAAFARLLVFVRPPGRAYSSAQAHVLRLVARGTRDRPPPAPPRSGGFRAKQAWLERLVGGRTLVLRTLYGLPMDIVGLGVDLAEIERVRRLLAKYGEAFKRRCFTDHEWEYAHRYADPSGRLAARFAGKEAVMKSLGMGWRRLRWKDIEVTGGGAPRVNLSGTAARRAEALGVTTVLITITHTADSALVMAMSARS